MSIAQRKWFFKGLPCPKASHPLNWLYRKMTKKKRKKVKRRLNLGRSMAISAVDIRAAVVACDRSIVTNVLLCDHDWDCKRWRVITTAPVQCYDLTNVERVFKTSFTDQLEEQYGNIVEVSDEHFVMPRDDLYVEVGASVSVCPRNHAGLLLRTKHSDPYEAFLFGDEEALNGPNVSRKLLSLMRTIRSRRLKVVENREMGNELLTLDAIEPFGAICVYGGNFIPPDQVEVSKTHTRTLGRNAGQIDAPYPLGLPSTHWGALANSSMRPTASFEYVRWEKTNHVRDIIVLIAGRNGIGCEQPIETNYRVEF